MKLVVANVYLQVFFLLVCGFLWYKLLRIFNVKILFLYICVFSVWLMSGRTIGVFSYGTAKMGWFFFKIDEVDICVDNKTDCQTISNYQTTVEAEFFWRVQIKNKQVNHGTFIGPVIWYQALKMLKNEFGAGGYTK